MSGILSQQYFLISKNTRNPLEQSLNQFDVLKKRAVKNQAKVKIQIFERSKDRSDLIDEVLISEAFYSVD